MKNRIQKIVLMVVFLLTLTPLPLSAQATISEEPDFPEIKSDYVYMVDLDNNQIMLDEGSEQTIYPASMTKMMTLLVAIENAPALESTMVLGPEVFAGLRGSACLGCRV
ncbi:MAG: hypothetical protein ACLSA6_00105 [Holdemania massiliensis]